MSPGQELIDSNTFMEIRVMFAQKTRKTNLAKIL